MSPATYQALPDIEPWVDVTDSIGRRNPGAFRARSRRHIMGAILRLGYWLDEALS